MKLIFNILYILKIKLSKKRKHRVANSMFSISITNTGPKEWALSPRFISYI
jgi:hypothetical protein